MESLSIQFSDVCMRNLVELQMKFNLNLILQKIVKDFEKLYLSDYQIIDILHYCYISILIEEKTRHIID